MAAPTAPRASDHDAGASSPSAPRTNGSVSRCRLRPSYEKRALSAIHSSLMSSLHRGMMRMTSPARVLTTMFDPSASITSTESVLRSSHVRAVKAYGLEVSAPTGHRSMTLPDSSELNIFSIYVPIWRSPPRPVVPRSSTPATSEPKRTQRVQWMHRVMMVLTRGPMFLSSTARLLSKVLRRPRSDPKAIDWSWRSHSPPWSQMGQSSGWFTRRNSITPSRASLVFAEPVSTFMLGATGTAHDACGLGQFSTSTRHIRQFPAIERRSW
mmetsp:Transcript_23787/g.62210  ORF Transcript_23787/g.62210 Transcript_23787/m.62210 type:complete len:268 (+) Transcript_23787:2289-3092(+)